MKDDSGNVIYKYLSVLIKALMCLAHGDADAERGFSDNNPIIEGRSNLDLRSINSLRCIKSYIQEKKY